MKEEKGRKRVRREEREAGIGEREVKAGREEGREGAHLLVRAHDSLTSISSAY